mmetsp:Transcript_23429/g.54322  ORF Transcript_23429/g.54322 Transcript_23429/m.54322 type:complete len:210 (-) Transcript_23429:415-1044(-)
MRYSASPETKVPRVPYKAPPPMERVRKSTSTDRMMGPELHSATVLKPTDKRNASGFSSAGVTHLKRIHVANWMMKLTQSKMTVAAISSTKWYCRVRVNTDPKMTVAMWGVWSVGWSAPSHSGTGCPGWSDKQIISRTEVQSSALSCATEDAKPARLRARQKPDSPTGRDVSRAKPNEKPPSFSPTVARNPSCHMALSGSTATPTANGST